MQADTEKNVVGEKHIFSTLDAMRGIAAVSVVIYHYSHVFKVNLIPHAYLAVDFFFVLSGFVIAKAYESRLSHGMSV